MPAAVERCVNSLLAKWKSDPSKRPAPREKGQAAKEQAWAICQAAYNKHVKNSLEIMLGEGNGPTFIGAAATNRPYIPHLKPTRVIEQDGEKMLLVHLANSGEFNHPSGPFTLNRAVYSMMIHNMHTNVLGQDAAYDCRHRPNDGAYGWFQDLMLGDQIGEGEKEFWGLVKPTPVGLERIEGGEFRYSSMEFHRNFQRDDVVLDLEHTDGDFCLVDLVDEANEEEMEENDMSGNKDDVSLEEYKKESQLRMERLEAEKKAAEERIEAAEKAAKAAEERALKLQREAIDAEASAVIELAQGYRDKDGNALPRQLIEWGSNFLLFKEFGEGDQVIRLEEGVEVPGAVRKYCIAAVKSLVLSMPGSVPTKRDSHSGSDGGGNEDKFDYAAEWGED